MLNFLFLLAATHAFDNTLHYLILNVNQTNIGMLRRVPLVQEKNLVLRRNTYHVHFLYHIILILIFFLRCSTLKDNDHKCKDGHKNGLHAN